MLHLGAMLVASQLTCSPISALKQDLVSLHAREVRQGCRSMLRPL